MEKHHIDLHHELHNKIMEIRNPVAQYLKENADFITPDTIKYVQEFNKNTHEIVNKHNLSIQAELKPGAYYSRLTNIYELPIPTLPESKQPLSDNSLDKLNILDSLKKEPLKMGNSVSPSKNEIEYCTCDNESNKFCECETVVPTEKCTCPEEKALSVTASLLPIKLQALVINETDIPDDYKN